MGGLPVSSPSALVGRLDPAAGGDGGSSEAHPDLGAGAPPGASTQSFGVRWRAVALRWRIVLVLLAVVAGVDVAAALGGSLGGGSAGASGPSSSFDTTPPGTQAMAELLQHDGYPVRRLEQPLSAGVLSPATTLVVADPVSWDAGQSAAVAAFVRAGGHAVLAGGPFGSADLRTILGTGDIPVLSPVGVGSARAVGHAPEVAGVTVVDCDPSGGAWDVVGRTTAILRNGSASLAVAADVGSGRVVLLASASPLRNALLGEADNAAFALDLAGGHGRAVVFDEYAHGFGSGGIDALPGRWKWALLLAAAAALAWVWSAARRFGPPQDAERPMAPARAGYVEGLATVLAATDARSVGAAVEPVGRAARAALCRLVGVPEDTGDDALAARRAPGRDPRRGGTGRPRRTHRHAGGTGHRSCPRLARTTTEVAPMTDWGPPDTTGPNDTPGTSGAGGPATPGGAATQLAQLRGRVQVEVAKAVVGQEQVVDAMLLSMAVGGHLLLEGAPGVAKTLLATAVGRALGLDVRRVQFTPDLLPTDLTGTLVLRGSELVFRQGPVFTNLLLADEINRTPPKTQAALLEAMQEAQVSVDGVPGRSPIRSWWWPPRTPSSTRARTRSPRPSSTASS